MTLPETARRRRWPLLIVVIVVIAVLIGAWFAGDAIARTVVGDKIRADVTERFGLDANHPIDVELEGSVLAQLITGTLNEVVVSADDVPLGGVSGDLLLAAKGVPIRDEDAPMDAAAATVTLGQPALQEALAASAGIPRGTVLLNAPELVLLTSVPLGGFPLELGIGLVPTPGEGEQAGQLMLDPSSASLGDVVLTAAQLREQLGGVADAILQPLRVCVAERMPEGIALSGVVVQGTGVTGSLVLSVTIDGRILIDPALRVPGSC